MLSIYVSTDLQKEASNLLHEFADLQQYVRWKNLNTESPEANALTLIINDRGINQMLDWHNSGPPYLLPRSIELTGQNLGAILYFMVGDIDSAISLLDGKELADELKLMYLLREGYELEPIDFVQDASEEMSGNKYRYLHNGAIMRHYGYVEQSEDYSGSIYHMYEKALDNAPEGEHLAFTSLHYGTLLADGNDHDKAESIIQAGLKAAISEDAQLALNLLLSNVWIRQLRVPPDSEKLVKAKILISENIRQLQGQNRTLELALSYIDASHLYSLDRNLPGALEFVNNAIEITHDEDVRELWAAAQTKKGTILFDWAQDDNPQHYKASLAAFQRALEVFTKAASPAAFADIHHYLGQIYAEMPAEKAKRSLLAGISMSSFKEALEHYARDRFPYEYAMICNSYGNALTKYPPAVNSDNYEKALFYYQEALVLRTPSMPVERAITLLNFLEASWKVGNVSDEFNKDRFKDMKCKAQEILSLVDNAELIEEAERHLQLLNSLEAKQKH